MDERSTEAWVCLLGRSIPAHKTAPLKNQGQCTNGDPPGFTHTLGRTVTIVLIQMTLSTLDL